MARFILYWASWFSDAPNAFIVNDPALTYSGGQLWRIFLSPLLVTSFWFDLALCMPIWLCFFCYVREY